MKEKLTIIKNSFIAFVNGIKNIIKKAFRGIKRIFVYARNMMRFSVPFLLTIIVLLVMYVGSENKCHKLELENKSVEAIVISEYFVAEELKTIGKLKTAEYTYTIEHSISEPRKVFNWEVPLTEKTLSIMYSGQMNVGYNTEDIVPTIIGKEILLKIPTPIVENCITKEVVKDEDNNIFNPIKGEDYMKLREGVLDKGYNNAVAKGIYEEAESELKNILSKHFNQLGYHVNFI